MKKLITLLGISLFCLAASAQPMSFGGVTPGQTTLEELSGLVKNPRDLGTSNDIHMKLKQPEGISASIRLQNNVVC